jgi:hypothetical protein
MIVYLSTPDLHSLTRLAGHRVAMTESLNETSIPDGVSADDRARLLAESAEVEASVAVTADVIAYDGELAPGIEILAIVTGKPVMSVEEILRLTSSTERARKTSPRDSTLRATRRETSSKRRRFR